MYSPSIDRLIQALKKLPAVGEHTAERYVFHFLKSGKKEVGELMLALKNLMQNVTSCRECFNFSDASPCALCRDLKRDHSFICVVGEPQDLMTLERTRSYRGLYHVLRGLVDATDPEIIAKLKIRELLARARPTAKTRLREILLALNPTLAGETTMLYLEKELKKINPDLKVTRLARGLPLGADVRYADELTLESAIKNRT